MRKRTKFNYQSVSTPWVFLTPWVLNSWIKRCSTSCFVAQSSINPRPPPVGAPEELIDVDVPPGIA